MSDFKQQLLTIFSHGTLSLSIALGLKLGLFDALSNFSEENPATAEALAQQLELKPRYVFEWLSAMVCGDIIESDKDGKKFWIPENKRDIISGQKEPIFTINALLPILGEECETVATVFRKDGPPKSDLHSNHRFHENAHAFNNSKHANFKKYLLSDYLPKLGMKEKLEEGIDVLDIGCGPGIQVIELAQLFPKSSFIGFDVSEKVIEHAIKQKEEKDLKNVEFLCMDAKEFKSDWTEKFDLAISFDSCHHHQHPEMTIKEVYRVLKPGGLFALIEVDGTTDNAYNDKQNKSLAAALTYSMGLYNRKSEEDPNTESVGMFALWGINRVTKLLNYTGFKNVKAEKTQLFELNVLYLANK